MNKFTATAIAVPSALLIVGASVVLIVASVQPSLMNDAKQKTERITTCLEAGGTWLDYNSDCVQ